MTRQLTFIFLFLATSCRFGSSSDQSGIKEEAEVVYRYDEANQRCPRYKKISDEEFETAIEECKLGNCQSFECHDLQGKEFYTGQTPLENVNFDGANLIGANLTYVKLNNSSLRGVLLHLAQYYGTTQSTFTNCDFRGADFGIPVGGGFSLEGSDLRGANLAGVEAIYSEDETETTPILKNTKIDLSTILPYKTKTEWPIDEMSQKFQIEIVAF